MAARSASARRRPPDRMQPGFRADHCGSLIRPDALRRARREVARGRMPREALKPVEDAAIIDALQRQRDVGLDVVSDGEFRRGTFLSAISTDYFNGMANEGVDLQRFPFLKDRNIEDADLLVPEIPAVVGKLSAKKRILAGECAFLTQHARAPWKVAIPSPVMLTRTSWRAGVTHRVYAGWRDLFDDYAGLIAAELAATIADGATYVQLDAPFYTRFLVPQRRAELTARGVDLNDELDRAIAADNRCLRAARAPGVTTAVHVCLGTFVLAEQGPLGGAGDYDRTIVGRLLNELDADVFLFEYSQRVGSLETLTEAPRDRVICLGVVNVRDPGVESVDEIMRRVEQAARYFPVEQMTLSPNCGFSGGAAAAFVDETVQWRKLANMVAAARKIWP